MPSRSMPIMRTPCAFRSAHRLRIASMRASAGFAARSIASRSGHTFRVGSTLREKVWERPAVQRAAGELYLLYVDLHLVHEVTSPQAVDAIRLVDPRVRRPHLTIESMEHTATTRD